MAFDKPHRVSPIPMVSVILCWYQDRKRSTLSYIWFLIFVFFFFKKTLMRVWKKLNFPLFFFSSLVHATRNACQVFFFFQIFFTSVPTPDLSGDLRLLMLMRSCKKRSSVYVRIWRQETHHAISKRWVPSWLNNGIMEVGRIVRDRVVRVTNWPGWISYAADMGLFHTTTSAHRLSNLLPFWAA